MASLAEKVIAAGKKLGFDLVGIIDAEKLGDVAAKLKNFQRQGYLSPFLGDSPEKRGDPKLLLPNGQSVIMVGLAYGRIAKNSPPQKLFGQVAPSAWGEDYHLKIYPMLEQLVSKIRALVAKDFHYTLFVDNKAILEKAFAVKAGLGFYGKNSLLINPQLGSYLFLGGLITDLDLANPQALLADQKSGKDFCGPCNKCMRACPTQAIVEPRVIDTGKCLAQLTQNKGVVPTDYREKLAYNLYGCNVCQQVCPYNQQKAAESAAESNLFGYYDLTKVLEMSNKEFKSTIGKTAAGWRGKTIFQRNGIIALGNWGDEQAIPLLAKALKDERPVIRIHAAWALGKIGGQQVQNILEKALEKEKNQQVIEEISLALKKQYK